MKELHWESSCVNKFCYISFVCYVFKDTILIRITLCGNAEKKTFFKLLIKCNKQISKNIKKKKYKSRKEITVRI